MSKIRLHGSSSGYTEIAPVAASSNNTITLPDSGTIISKDANGAVGVTSITVGTGVTIGDGRVTCSTLHGSASGLTGALPALNAASLTSIPAANIVGVCTSGLTKTGGFGNLVHISTTTISSSVASVTITNSFSDYDVYRFLFVNFATASDNRDLYARVSDSGGEVTGNYRSMTQNNLHGLSSAWRLNYNNIGGAASGDYTQEAFFGDFYFSGFGANQNVRYFGLQSYQNNGNDLYSHNSGGTCDRDEAMVSIRFYFDSGNIKGNGGKLHFYGVNNG